MKNILFICQHNLQRSPTAAKIYSDDPRYSTRSTGASKLRGMDEHTHEILEWADEIYVMERHHRNRIQKEVNEIYKTKKIICLYVPDEYDYMEEELITILKEKLDPYLN